MRRPSFVTLISVAALCLASVALAPAASAEPSQNGLDHRNVPVCDHGPDGTAYCHAIRNDKLDSHGKVVPNFTPNGFGPADLETAYGLPSYTAASTPPSGPLVAIVDAYDDPNAAQDLTTYRSQYRLPPCTTANGCFRKVNQSGGTTPPRANAGWAQEISLDLDMVSAACPNCKILLVEASSASFSNLGAAVNTAVSKFHAVAVSNSYGGSDTSQLSAYNQPGVAITASTGDNGYGVEAPASFNTVVAVGGTSLTKSATGYSETVWSGAGSGCSTLNSQPAGQVGLATGCSGRANADVSAVADPNTGVAVYDSYSYQGVSGWLIFGGTSAASPIVASAYALGGIHSSYPADYTYSVVKSNSAAVHDVQQGSNGTCTTSQLCNAQVGWDGPTGLGTPNGTSAF